eukprot:scaffold32210_cov39-Phaeocystis_antarctica.AAC.1
MGAVMLTRAAHTVFTLAALTMSTMGHLPGAATVTCVSPHVTWLSPPPDAPAGRGVGAQPAPARRAATWPRRCRAALLNPNP